MEPRGHRWFWFPPSNFSRLYFVVSLLPLPSFQSRHVLPKCLFWSRFSMSFFVNHVYLRVVSSLIWIISSTRTTRSHRLFRSNLDDLLYPSSALLHSLFLFFFLSPLLRYHIHGVCGVWCVCVCVCVCLSVCSFTYAIIGSQWRMEKMIFLPFNESRSMRT